MEQIRLKSIELEVMDQSGPNYPKQTEVNQMERTGPNVPSWTEVD